MISPTPRDRAAKAATFLGTYDEQGREETDAIDAITDIMHCAHQKGWDPQHILHTAQMHFEIEIEEAST
jgi:hypothetical protein